MRLKLWVSHSLRLPLSFFLCLFLSLYLSSQIESWVQSWQCVLWCLHSISVKYRTCYEKVNQFIRSTAPVTQNHRSKHEGLILQNALILWKSAPLDPSPRTYLWWGCLLYRACHTTSALQSIRLNTKEKGWGFDRQIICCKNARFKILRGNPSTRRS